MNTNNKLPRLFQPGMKLYFSLLFIFAVSTFFIGNHQRVLGGIMVFVLILLAVIWRLGTKKRTKRLLDYLESMSDGLSSTVRDTVFPAVIFNSETHEILWSNDRFLEMTGLKEPFFELRVSDVVPDFAGEWLLDGKSESPECITVGEKKFRVYGSIIPSEGGDVIATTYWVDVTELEQISEEYHDSRSVFAIISLDNYEELTKGLSEREKSTLLTDVDEKINIWIRGSDSFLCRYTRDKYFLLLEEKSLISLVEGNFYVLDSVRTIIGANGIHATLSIGIGKDGKSPLENSRFAALSMEMALSRGGDQAVVRNKFGFEFFGGHTVTHDNPTKVRSRIMANAFGELVRDASAIYVMGHKFADFDSVAAACGCCCIARAKDKKAFIVIDAERSNALELMTMFDDVSEYEGVFISEQEAILSADSNCLLVVVDTTRPDKVESESLLLSCTQIAVIDHHRRAAKYIENAIFNFHEPYASSTSELITEMLQYIVEVEDILRVEADALLAGMALDTKGFSINTTSRTFEAAAFLKRVGASASTAKRLMQADLGTATSRYAIMSRAVICSDGIAIAFSTDVHDRIAVAQAADELLNVKGVNTSFVAAQDGPDGRDVFLSGRSYGGVNVQVVLEKLGGGGSQKAAGLQVANADVTDVVDKLKNVLEEMNKK